MRNTTLTNHSWIVVLSLVLTICLAVVWAGRAHAYADGQLDISDPGPLTDKQTFKVSDHNNRDRKLEKGKFTKVDPQPPGIVSIKNPPAADDGVFEITPLKVGKATVAIEYKVDDTTVLKGTRDVFVINKNVQIVNLGDPPLKLLAPQSKSFDVSATNFDGGTTKVTTADVLSDDEDIANGDFDGQRLNIHAKTAGKTKLTLKQFDNALTSVNVEVTEGVAKIEVDNGGAVTSGDVQLAIPEGETKQLKVKIVGVNGTELKPADVDLKTTVEAADNCGALQVTYDDKDPKLLNIAAPLLTTATGCSSRKVTLSIAAKKVNSDSTLADLTTQIRISITPKVGFIRLTPSSLFLGQNGRMKITADVFNASNVQVVPAPDVTFNLADDKDTVWVSVAKEGNTVTLVSRNPTQKEIRDKNDNELVTRPSAVVVVAKTRLDTHSPQIDSSISISLGEVVGFDLLKVKLNLMDERTAGDLYGKVTSDEYYVLTVRLFNNLKNERTGGFDGNSILAYSSSIEVAVGLEKRFDAGTDSYFPNVIKESDAKKIAKENATRASTLLSERFLKENEALTAAQAQLNEALKRLYTARQEALSKMSEALKYKVKAQDLTATARAITDPRLRAPAFAKANVAINEYNQAWAEADAALKTANDLDEQVINLRRTFARRTAELAPIRQDLARLADPDTAIDDGLWHPLTPADLNRLNPIPAPSPTDADSAVNAGPLPLLTDAELRSRSTRGSRATTGSSEPPPPPRDPDEDPPCVGVITYRPFTFEMMVNTVDRRDSRSVRSKVFRVLDFIGTGTSFVTSVAVPGAGSDLPLGLEKYRNLLLPGLDKIWPNYKEQQRQNIVSQAMKEIEEIPFGSDITRVIFIPKKTIHGLVRGHDARISEVCPYFFRVQVAIVSKNAQVEQGTIRQTPQ